MRKLVRASDLNRRIVIERPDPNKDLDGAGSGTWHRVAEVSASVVDVLPSRTEKLADGITTTSRPARVRIRYRPGMSADMRFVMGDRIMQIVGSPAEIGFREGLEFLVEDFSPAGNPA